MYYSLSVRMERGTISEQKAAKDPSTRFGPLVKRRLQCVDARRRLAV